MTANRKEEVLEGLQLAAVQIRRAVGEPAASLDRYNVPIVEATTSSLEALRALRRGDLARERGHADVALAFYREAVLLDPEFALAYGRIATISDRGPYSPDFFDSLNTAFELRHRVTMPERLEIEANYHERLGNQTKAVETLELLKRTYPRRTSVRRSLALQYRDAGNHEAALAEAAEALRLEPDSPMNYSAVAVANLMLNRIGEARANAERGLALGGTSPLLHLVLFQCGLATGDQQMVARERAWAGGNPEVTMADFGLADAEESMNRGRLQESLRLLRQIEDWATGRRLDGYASLIRLRMARFEALVGLHNEAMRRLHEEMRRGLTPPASMEAAKILVAAGEFDLAGRLLDDLESRGGRGYHQRDAFFIAACRSAIDVHFGRFNEALARLTPLEPFDLGEAYGLVPLYERGRAHYAAGHWPEARAAFEKMLSHQTIWVSGKLFPSARLYLARTLARSGDIPASRKAYEQFLEVWKTADPDLPMLQQARREYNALVKM